jgi:ATP synthase F1 delta subunit
MSARSAAGHEAAVNSYAQALFSSGKRQGLLARMLEESKMVAALLKANPAFATFLEGPQIPTEKKRELIDRAFGRRLSQISINLLYMMVDRERARLLGRILEEFAEVAERAEGIHPARVTTAHELNFDQKQKLKAALEKHTDCRLRIDYAVKPELIGGLVFRFRDVLIDASLRHGLDGLEKHLHRKDRRAA